MQWGNIVEIGFLMGLLGSIHCVGMCGPLVMAMPIAQKTMIQKWASLILYHMGKMTSYALLGVLFGLLGSQFPFYIAQQNLSIVIGVIMLFYVLYVFVLKPKKMLQLDFLYQPIITHLSILFKKETWGSYWMIGLLNGLLPCGMVYLALSSALATQQVLQGGLFMFLFGLGTVPALLLVALGGQYMRYSFRQQLQKLLPFFIFSMGVLLILRGMNLGIPYVSPSIGIGNGVISCHN
jgi:hypothetical protein